MYELIILFFVVLHFKFYFLLKELYNGTNYEYDYYGNKITEASKRICLQLQKEEEYLATLDKILSKKNFSGYDKRICTA